MEESIYKLTGLRNSRGDSVEDVLYELDFATLYRPRVSILKAVVIANDKKMFEALTHSGARTAIYIAGRYPLSNLIEILENLMENISPPMRVSRRTLQEIFRRTCNRTSAVDNPHELDNLHLDKKRKIYCGRKQFRDILEMGNRGIRVITKASQLPDGGA